MNRRFAILVVAMLSALPLLASGQQGVRPYDGIQAGLDAYRLGEERRRSDFQQQIDVNQDLRARSGMPGLYGETMSYRDPLRPSRFGPVDTAYGYGGGYADVGYAASPYGNDYGPGLDPWPYDDRWAPNYVTPFRQPVGRWEGQTGPNRWESHPVYDPPLAPYRPSPPVDSPWLDRTPYATPRARVYEWSDGFEGTADTELPPPPPASLGAEPDIVYPPEASSRTADDFDTPRRVRELREHLPPPPPSPRVREF